MWYSKLKFLSPSTKAEALAMLSDNAAQPIAGGTDLLVQARTNRNRAKAFIRIDQLAELKTLKFSNNELTIGAGLTYTEYLENASEVLPPLTKAVALIASPSIRNAATFGGNIVNASPAADTLPVLYALNAVLTLESFTGTRQILVSEFVTGPKKTIIRSDELLTAIHLRIPNNYKYSYRKIGPRKALSLSKVSFVGISLPDAGEIRLAYGSVGPTVIRAFEAERLFCKGKISAIPDSVEQTVRPISDQRSTAEYRRYLCRALTEDFLRII